ncbi:hypothetical protein [Pseudomonas khavaziana]|uniref:hypothetical protein n=1 Tax=Pseudomonas khavaziana TaxID=2842351 RepID=UPI001CEDC8BD|nr:hypothetical protein [Pseudomonas khavaziana]
MKLMRIGVDLAKNVFQIHDVDDHKQPVWRKRLSGECWLKAVLEKTEPGCEIAMEVVALRTTERDSYRLVDIGLS